MHFSRTAHQVARQGRRLGSTRVSSSRPGVWTQCATLRLATTLSARPKRAGTREWPRWAPFTTLLHPARQRRSLQTTPKRPAVKPVLLADIGEGIVECEIIQWFVEPGARVEEFSPLCEVQSDKASVEITSRFAGVVKKLYYDAGEMAKVGKPFVDIDISGHARQEDIEALTADQASASEQTIPASSGAAGPAAAAAAANDVEETSLQQETKSRGEEQRANQNRVLATPAVRHVSKELNVDITQIDGTGKDGRVRKEDIYKFVESGRIQPNENKAFAGLGSSSSGSNGSNGSQTETPVTLTKTQEHMFKAMTKSLAIPHFLYADEVDFTSLCELRGRLNKVLGKQSAHSSSSRRGSDVVAKLSYLPFVIKAVSMALYEYPILNARVDMPDSALSSSSSSSKPGLVLRSQHNIGIAMDTPSGLLVPVIRDVGARNVLSIASELARLQRLAAAGQLSPHDLGGGTITVSNIGTIGGTYLSPVIVEREVAILGVGRLRTVPAFDEHDRVVKRQVCHFSWSADHRVVDGATLARAAEVVRRIVEEPDVMVMHLR